MIILVFKSTVTAWETGFLWRDSFEMRKNMRLKKIESGWARIAPRLKLNTDVSKTWLAEETLKGNAFSEKLFVTFGRGECRRKPWGNGKKNHLPRSSYLYLLRLSSFSSRNFAKGSRMHTHTQSKIAQTLYTPCRGLCHKHFWNLPSTLGQRACLETFRQLDTVKAQVLVKTYSSMHLSTMLCIFID